MNKFPQAPVSQNNNQLIQPLQPQKKFPFPKSFLVGFGLFFAISSMVGGIVVMQSKDVKGIPIRMRVAQQPTTVPPTPAPPTEVPDPTKDWKLYANKSFSIKYPARFKVEEKNSPITTLYPKIYSSVVFTDAESTITITVARNTQNYTLDTALGNGPSLRYTADYVKNKTIRNIPVAGTTARIVEDISPGIAGATRDMMIIKDGKIYQLTLAPQHVDATTFMLMVASFQILNQEPTDETDSWLLHTDNAYLYSFRYPLTYALDYNKVASGSPTLTIVYDNTNVQVDTPRLKVEVQDLKNFGQSALTSRDILKLGLEDYVNKKWEYNKAATDSAYPNRKVSPVKETAIDGKLAYSFTVTNKYVDDHVSEILSEEYVFVFTEVNGYKYKIWYPKSNVIYGKIFNTIMFTR